MLFAFIAILVLGVSQASGYWVDSNIAVNSTLEVTSFLHFTHIRNYGGVFGLAQGMGWLFALVSVALLLMVVLYLALGRDLHRIEYISFGFIVGGGASNILDRLLRGSVIDFIDVQHIPFWNYVFNIADVMIHVGIWPMLIYSLFFHQAQADSHG